MYVIQESPAVAVLTSTSLALTSAAIEGVYTCRGTNQFGENSSDITILVQSMFNAKTILFFTTNDKFLKTFMDNMLHLGGEGEASSVYVRFSTTLSNEVYSDQDIILASFEYNVRLAIVCI